MDDAVSSSSHPSSSASERLPDALRFALFYADHGWRVFPLHYVMADQSCSCANPKCSSIGKHPMTKNGVKDATSSATRLQEWWRRFPQANVGIATGKGLLVVDIDPRHGGSLEQLKSMIALPVTSTVQTGGGGWHLYFLYNKRDYEVRNSTSKLAQGIDTRGEGGYVVAPPSNHLLGKYRWTERRSTPERAPTLLLQRLEARPPTQPPSGPQAALQKKLATQMELAAQVQAVPQPEQGGEPSSQQTQKPEPGRGIVEGKRNETMLRLAGSLFRHGADEEVLLNVLPLLNQACCHPPLPEQELRSICARSKEWEQKEQSDEPAFPNPDVRMTGLYAIKSAMTLLAQTLPEPRWSVPNFLPEGVTLLAGKPKMGKSWLTLQLALDLARGETTLGCLPTCQGEVLFLGLEDSERRITDRIRKLLEDRAAPVELTWGGMWARMLDGGLDDLEVWLRLSPNARLIVIDTLEKFRAPNSKSGSMYAEDYAAITPLKQLTEKYHISILLVHHLRKAEAEDPMDMISGSTGLTGATDCNMVLQRGRGEHEAVLHVTGRDVEEQTLNLIFDKESARWSLSDAPASSKALSPDRQAIIDLLQQEGRLLGPNEIAERLNKDNGATRKMLRMMVRDCQIASPQYGLYTVIDAEQQATLKER